MDRLERVRQVVDEIVRQQPGREESRCGFVHLYGVSAICALLALKRGLDPQLAAVAGMLHDIWTYKVEDSPEHGPLSALEAGRILGEPGCFTPQEVEVICRAISRHSAKDQVDGELDELLKDADVLQHHLYSGPSTTTRNWGCAWRCIRPAACPGRRRSRAWCRA